VFSDDAGKMNLNLEQVGGSMLVISQFTLYADLKKRRPGFSHAAPPAMANELYEVFMQDLRDLGVTVEHGEFGADMQVESVNDGPVTLCFDTEAL
jgi:D-tyrosyl-tRNA(Tyr) deacylase